MSKYTDKDRQRKAEYYRAHKEEILRKRRNRVRSEEQMRHAREYAQKWREEHPERIKAYGESEKGKEYKQQYNKEYYQTNKERLRLKNREYRKRRAAADSSFRTKLLLRNLLFYAFRKYSTMGKIMSSRKYGIDYRAIVEHLGPCPALGFHIDHIIPLSVFDFDNPTHVRAAFAPENHQWLPAHDNLSKSDHYSPQMLEAYLSAFDGGAGK